MLHFALGKVLFFFSRGESFEGIDMLRYFTLLFLLRHPWKKGLVWICRWMCPWLLMCTVRWADSLLQMHLLCSNCNVWIDLNCSASKNFSDHLDTPLVCIRFNVIWKECKQLGEKNDCMLDQLQISFCRILKSEENWKISCQRSL